MKARIRRISASVDTALSPTSSCPSSTLNNTIITASTTTTATLSTTIHLNDNNLMPDYGYSQPPPPPPPPSTSKSLDICVPESRIERMRKLLSSPLLKRKNASHHHHHHHHHHPQQYICSSYQQHSSIINNNNRQQQQQQLPQSSSSASSSPSSSPALGQIVSMKTFGVSLESLSHYQQQLQQNLHQQQQHSNIHHCMEEYYVRDPEQIIVPHQKAAHILGQACPGCLTSAPSNSSSTGSINETTSSGHYSPHGGNADDIHSSLSSIVAASPSSGNSSSSTTSSTASSTGNNGGNVVGSGGGGGGGVNSGNVSCLIPFVVTRLCTFIENSGGMVQEGLFRISGNVKVIDKLKQSFDNNGDAPLETDGDLAAAAALLKQFLRELPQPLIPNGSQFLDVIRSLKNDHDTCVLSLKALVSQLPDENYYTLRYLIRFLHRIAQRNEENRMTSTNLGIVFAPNIFRVCVDTYQGLKDQSSANEVVNLLISDYVEIFNETIDLSCHSVDSSGDLSYGSESQCLCIQCPTDNNNNNNNQQQQQQQQQHDETKTKLDSNDNNNNNNDNENDDDEETNFQLDEKRKSYRNKNYHHTIDDHQDDNQNNDHYQYVMKSQSFDFDINNDNDKTTSTLTTTSASILTSTTTTTITNNSRQKNLQPKRCNSEEMYNSNNNQQQAIKIIKNDNLFQQNNKNTTTATIYSHEIIITNSSDSVSTDDNTTTATSTGQTVRSVIIGVENIELCNNNNGGIGNIVGNNNNNGGDMIDTSEDNFNYEQKINNKKLLTVNDKNNINNNTNKGIRSSSCGSDCSENVNISTSLSFASDDEEEDEGNGVVIGDNDDNNNDNNDDDDSLLKSMASECSDDDDDNNNDMNSTTSSSNDNNNNEQKNEDKINDDKENNENNKENEMKSSQNNDNEDDVDNNDKQKFSTINEQINKCKHRRLRSIRKKLKQFEINFEQENGYKATFENKLGSSFARPLMIELNQLIKQINIVDNENIDDSDNEKLTELLNNNNNNNQLIKDSSTTTTTTNNNNNVFTTDDIFNTIFGNKKDKNLQQINEVMNDIQRTLNEKRIIAQRPESIELMTMEQIVDEKLALQKALLRFEALYGRPNSKQERDIVRPVYDRYRLLKRHVSKLNQKQLIKLENDNLQPILENVQMNFISPTHEKKLILKTLTTTKTAADNENQKEKMKIDSSENNNQLIKIKNCDYQQQLSTSTLSSKDKNYHIMTNYELITYLNEYRQQKRNLRSVLRTFENDFYKKTGRHVEKEDRSNMSTVYLSYKRIKGKIKLIEALISKKNDKSEK